MQVVEYDITVAAIQEMKDKYIGLVITDTESYESVRLAIADVREKRIAVEEKRKDLKADALAYGRKVDSTAKEITALLLDIENPLKVEKKKEDDRKEAIKEAKAQKERERIEKIQGEIRNKITCWIDPSFLFGKTAKEIKGFVSMLMDIVITPQVYQEFEAEAHQTLSDTINSLEDAYEARVKFEQEEVDRKIEAERLEKQRKEQEAAQAKIDEENRKIQEEKDRIAEKQRADNLRREQEEFERQATIKAEKEAKEKVEREAKEKKEREEAEAAEAKRQEALKPDKTKLIDWATNIDLIVSPKVISKEAQLIVRNREQSLNEITRDIIKQANEL